MRNTLLHKLLAKLESKKLARFEKYVQSPYFNQREDIEKLISYYKKEIKKSNAKLKNEDISKAVYGNPKVKEQDLRLLISRTMTLFKDFLVIEQASKNGKRKESVLADEFFKLGFENLFVKTFAKSKQDLEAAKERDLGYFKNLYDLELQYYNYISEQVRNEAYNLQETTDSLDVYYFASKLMHACLILGHQAVYKNNYNIDSINHLIDYLDDKVDLVERHPILAIYYYCYKAMTSSEHEKSYAKFKFFKDSHEKVIRKAEIRGIYILAINYCIRRINSGDKVFYDELFDLYKKGIENHFLITNNILSQYTYKNVVSLGLVLKEYQWVESFIYDYQDNLDFKYRSSYFTYNLAKLKQEQKKYGEAMSLLVHFNPDDTLMALASKKELIKMYFELREYTSLESLLQSMDKYLDRKKGLGYHKTHYKNIIKFSRKLMNLAPYDVDERLKIRNQIELAEMSSEKDWFLAQLK